MEDLISILFTGELHVLAFHFAPTLSGSNLFHLLCDGCRLFAQVLFVYDAIMADDESLDSG